MATSVQECEQIIEEVLPNISSGAAHTVLLDPLSGRHLDYLRRSPASFYGLTSLRSKATGNLTLEVFPEFLKVRMASTSHWMKVTRVEKLLDDGELGAVLFARLL